MSDMKYHITYHVDAHAEGLAANDVPKDRGACTAVVIGSLLYPPDGSYSAAFFTRDGRTDSELDDAELWKAWMMLSRRLADSDTLSEPKKALCRDVFETIASAMRSAKNQS